MLFFFFFKHIYNVCTYYKCSYTQFKFFLSFSMYIQRVYECSYTQFNFFFKCSYMQLKFFLSFRRYDEMTNIDSLVDALETQFKETGMDYARPLSGITAGSQHHINMPRMVATASWIKSSSLWTRCEKVFSIHSRMYFLHSGFIPWWSIFFSTSEIKINGKGSEGWWIWCPSVRNHFSIHTFLQAACWGQKGALSMLAGKGGWFARIFRAFAMDSLVATITV